MNVSESLICMLSPKSLNLRGGAGGIPELSPLDIAAALAFLRLTDFETRYVRARILQSEPWHVSSDLAIDAWLWAKDFEIREQWNVPRGSYLTRKLAYLAVGLRVLPETGKCGGCRGTGVYRPKDSNVLAACRRCEGQRMEKATGKMIGSGRRRISARECAQALDVSDKTFTATWAPRLETLTGALLEIEHKVRYLPGVVFDD